MPFTEYVTTSQILEVIDEILLAKLVNRSNAKSWDRKAVERVKKTAAELFESHAANIYDVVTELRTDPPPTFAVTHVLNIIRYFLYSYNKRSQVPRNVELDYKDTMAMLTKWGNPLVLDEDGIIVVTSTGASAIHYNKQDEDLEFPYDTVAKGLFWGN